MQRLRLAFQQLSWLGYELRLMNNTRWWRWLFCWFTQPFWVICCYRNSRFWHLLLGPAWSLARFCLSPLSFLLRPWFGGCEIHFGADIGPGLLVLHPSLGLVISKHAKIGANCWLTGGNCIGVRGAMRPGELVIGDNVEMGAHAIVLGPVRIGNDVKIGAGAVVVRDAEDGCVLIGVPARPRPQRERVEELPTEVTGLIGATRNPAMSNNPRLRGAVLVERGLED